MVSDDFTVGDLVWAKMKNYPPWPAKIEDPSPNIKPPKNKKAHFVFFFGSKNYAWILDEYISPHNESVLNASLNKKKSVALQNAIDDFIIYSQKHKKEKSSPQKTKKRKIQSDKDTSVLNVVNSVSAKHRKKETTHKSPVKGAKRSLYDMNGGRGTYSPKSRKLKGYSPVTKVQPLVDEFSAWDDTDKERYEKYVAGQNAANRSQIDSSQIRFGFIGLGHMGKVIVRNILECGYNVTVWNKSTYKCIPLVELGAKQVQTPAELVVCCDIVFCCVSDPEASKELIFAEQGILKGLEKVETMGLGFRGYVEMTSIDPETSLGFNEAICMKNGGYLEAPLCGTSEDAEDGTLLVLASGDRRLFGLCESIFQAISKHAFFLSCQIGYSSKMTLVMNMFLGSVCVSAAEAIVLAEKLQIPKEHYLQLLRYWPLRIERILLLEEGMKNGCSVAVPSKIIQKDLNLALTWANNFSQPMRVTAAAHEIYKVAKLFRQSNSDASTEKS